MRLTGLLTGAAFLLDVKGGEDIWHICVSTAKLAAEYGRYTTAIIGTTIRRGNALTALRKSTARRGKKRSYRLSELYMTLMRNYTKIILDMISRCFTLM